MCNGNEEEMGENLQIKRKEVVEERERKTRMMSNRFVKMCWNEYFLSLGLCKTREMRCIEQCSERI